jgi:hypothetical protein
LFWLLRSEILFGFRVQDLGWLGLGEDGERVGVAVGDDGGVTGYSNFVDDIAFVLAVPVLNQLGPFPKNV